MMKAFIVNSAIVSSSVKFYNTATRSAFSPEERFRQTIYTLDNIRVQEKYARIYLVDCSIDERFDDQLEALTNVFNNYRYVPMRKLKRSVNDICTTHWHKSYCEALQMKTFLEMYREELSNTDFIYKLSGRYTFDFYRESADATKILFKRPIVFDWLPDWNELFSMIDYRKEEKHNLYYSYASNFFGYGSKYIDLMIDFYKFCMEITNDPNRKQYDMESLLYYYMRKHKNIVDHRDWTVMGFTGSNNWFQRF